MDLIRTYVTIILATLGLTVAVHSHSDDKRLLLDNEPTVDLGGEMSRLQAQLLDQQKLINAIQNELHLQTDTTAELKRQEVMLRQDNEQLKASQKAIQTDIQLQRNELQLQKNISTALQNDLQRQLNTTAEKLKQQEVSFQLNITELKQENKQLLAFQKGSGSVYVRWGRNVCPLTASVVYTGFTAGKHYNTGGSGSDNLCLPSDPTWSKYVDGTSSYRAYIYGTEIDTDDGDHIFNYPVLNQDLPCVVCRSTKTSTAMIPARNNCYDGWTLEYNGYLMAAYHNHNAFNYMCVDENPEFLQHGSTNDDQHILFLVEGQCGSLPCPPYVSGRELACVVCSK